MDTRTGKAVEGEQHLRQSIADILTTPLGSRVMRREYGSLLADLIDQPFNGATRVRLFGATASALMRWESRLRLTRVDLTPGDRAGAFVLTVTGARTDVPRSPTVRLTVPLAFPLP